MFYLATLKKGNGFLPRPCVPGQPMLIYSHCLLWQSLVVVAHHIPPDRTRTPPAPCSKLWPFPFQFPGIVETTQKRGLEWPLTAKGNEINKRESSPRPTLSLLGQQVPKSRPLESNSIITSWSIIQTRPNAADFVHDHFPNGM